MEFGLILLRLDELRSLFMPPMSTALPLQLLDDPLSAVDPRVGRILFDQCIGNNGLLAGGWAGGYCRDEAAAMCPCEGVGDLNVGTTRLLVTH